MDTMSGFCSCSNSLPVRAFSGTKVKKGMNQIDVCGCAECGEEGGASLKTCKACMLVKYCNANCQRTHWATHKKECKQRAAELRDEALFKDPPDKEDCPICFLPMPLKLICCVSLPPATISSVPIYDYADANTKLASKFMETYYPCCGKIICVGCDYSFDQSGNDKCPFCNSDQGGKTEEEQVEDLMKRVEANDAASIYVLADQHYQGLNGFQLDQAKAMELYTRAAELGYTKAHNRLGEIYHVHRGELRKAKFYYEAAAMAGHENARFALGILEDDSGNMGRAIKHFMIAASAGDYHAMFALLISLKKRGVSRESIDSTLAAYNSSCAEMRSEARDARIKVVMK